MFEFSVLMMKLLAVFVLNWATGSCLCEGRKQGLVCLAFKMI